MSALSDYKNIWVYAEYEGDKLKPITLELLSKVRPIALELKEELCVILIAPKPELFYAELAKYGAQKIYIVKGEYFAEYNTLPYSKAVINLITKYKPSAVLFPSSFLGRDLAPRVASVLHLGLTADCTDLSIKDNALLQTRPALGGNILADISSPNIRPQMATVRQGVFDSKPLPDFLPAQIIQEEITLSQEDLSVKVISNIANEKHLENNLSNADFVLCVGRGAKAKENAEVINQVATKLGASIGSTRALVEEGLYPKNHQVGQSGTTIKPKVYLSFGVSGALQHICGMEKSGLIISVNKDEHAQIFNFSDYGFVCDAPQTLKELQKLLLTKNKI